MGKLEEAARLHELRGNRDKEFSQAISEPVFLATLEKLLGLLTYRSSTELSLRITLGDRSFTDGKSITLGMPDNFFDRQYKLTDWAAMFKALLAHEAQHVNSSSFEDMERIREEYGTFMEKKGIPKTLAAKLGGTYLNIMEDSRIENIIIHNLPGFRTSFLLLNGEIRRLSGPDARAKTSADELADFQNNCLSYAKTGRLAPNIGVYAGTRLEAEFNAVKHLFDSAVDARTSKDCYGICKEMLWTVADYFADLLKDKAAQQQFEKQLGDDTDEYTSNSESEYNTPNGSDSKPESGSGDGEDAEGEPKGSGSGSDGKGESNGRDGGPGSGDSGKDKSAGGKDGKGEDSKIGGEDKGSQTGSGKDDSGGASDKGEKAPGGKQRGGQNALRRPDKSDLIDPDAPWTDDFTDYGPEGYDIQPITQSELAQIRRGIRDEFESESMRKPENKDPAKRWLSEIMDIYGDERIRTFRESFPRLPSSPLPGDLEITAKRMEKEFERILRQKRATRRNMRSGILSNRDLYRVGMRDPYIFMRKGQPLKADMAVIILLDNSASMGRNGARIRIEDRIVDFSKSHLSRVAAAIIERSLMKFAAIKITLFDVSISAVRHATLKNFDDTGLYSRAYNSINVVGIGGGNKDGYSIRVATKELLARRESKKVLVPLSDGLPSDYNGGEAAGMRDVHNAVREARRRGVITIPVMFGNASFRAAKTEEFKYMYDRYISCDPVDIANQFQKQFIELVKKA